MHLLSYFYNVAFAFVWISYAKHFWQTNLIYYYYFFSSSTFLQKTKLIIVIYGVQFVAKISNIRIWKYIQTTIRFSYLEMAHSRIWKRQIFVFEMNVFSNLKRHIFRTWKRRIFRIWKWHIFLFWKCRIFIFEMDTFSYLPLPRIFRIWKWHNFCICNWHIFRIWNCHIFRVWKRHISCFKTAHFVLDNKKAWWQSNMGNVNIWNVNTRNVKFKGQRQTAKTWSEGFTVSRFQIWVDKVIWQMSALEMSSSEGARKNSKNLKCSFLSFKVSRFQIWDDKVTWEISTFEMLAFKTPSVECKNKQRKFEVKVSMWLYEVSYVIIY